ncbi:MAG: hypothetical protein ACPGU5_01525 [Lishizhenia sp.]
MNSLVIFIDKHKGGILITVLLHFIVLIFVNFSTFNEKYELEKWSFKGKNIETDDIEIKADQVETPEEMALFEQQELLNAVNDVNNNEPTEKQDFYALPDEDYSADNALNFENSIKNEISKKKETEENTPANNDTTKPKNDAEDNDNSANSSNAPKGKTMVAFDLLNRTATRLKNPGYTCGNANGEVVVKIKVNQSGVVESAKYIPSQSNGTSCMIEKAEAYARNSKFNYSSDAPKLQEGLITYTFIYKK